MVEAKVFDPSVQMMGEAVVWQDKQGAMRGSDQRPSGASDPRIDDDEMNAAGWGDLKNLDQGRKCEERHEGGDVMGDIDQDGLLSPGKNRHPHACNVSVPLAEV